MNHLEIAKNLRLYNRWRRGEDETLEQPTPADIGTWLDAAADALEVAADAAVAQEQNAEQCVRLNRELGEARESSATYAHLLNVACSDLERKSWQLWHATWEANYIEEAIREFEEVKCELLRLVDRLLKERDEARAEIERWRVATAKLRDGAEEAGRVANEQIARAEERVKELEAETKRLERRRQYETDLVCAAVLEANAHGVSFGSAELCAHVDDIRALRAANAELAGALREMVDAQDATVEQFTETEIDRLEKAMRVSREVLARKQGGAE